MSMPTTRLSPARRYAGKRRRCRSHIEYGLDAVPIDDFADEVLFRLRGDRCAVKIGGAKLPVPALQWR